MAKSMPNLYNYKEYLKKLSCCDDLGAWKFIVFHCVYTDFDAIRHVTFYKKLNNSNTSFLIINSIIEYYFAIFSIHFFFF